jgi:hypothetical protein
MDSQHSIEVVDMEIEGRGEDDQPEIFEERIENEHTAMKAFGRGFKWVY